MSPQDAARAFDRFHRGARGGGADDQPAAGAGAGAGAGAAPGGSTGSGLGLSIVQAIAAAHGGYARLRTAPGAGTTVHLWIPVQFAGPRGAPAAGPPGPTHR
jgi:two-component system OmpR family sensor kinase